LRELTSFFALFFDIRTCAFNVALLGRLEVALAFLTPRPRHSIFLHRGSTLLFYKDSFDIGPWWRAVRARHRQQTTAPSTTRSPAPARAGQASIRAPLVLCVLRAIASLYLARSCAYGNIHSILHPTEQTITLNYGPPRRVRSSAPPPLASELRPIHRSSRSYALCQAQFAVPDGCDTHRGRRDDLTMPSNSAPTCVRRRRRVSYPTARRPSGVSNPRRRSGLLLRYTHPAPAALLSDRFLRLRVAERDLRPRPQVPRLPFDDAPQPVTRVMRPIQLGL
jgi:hypothetical protein